MNAMLADLWLYFEQGGYVMPPLALATVVLWYCIGHRWANLTRGRDRSVRRLIDKAARGKVKRARGVVDEAVLAGLEDVRRGVTPLRPYLDDRFARFERRIRRFRSIITGIVAVAPLLGLLGTVVGMIETFESLGDMSLFSQSGGIAGGISQALFTTQMGLAVAIPGLLMKGYLDRRQHRIEMDLAQIKDILCAEHGARSRENHS